MEIEERIDLLEATLTKLAQTLARDILAQRDKLETLAADHLGLEYAARALLPLISAPQPLISITLLHAYDALSDTLAETDATFRQQSLATFDVFARLMRTAHTPESSQPGP
jgi:hypothetical protein